MRAGKVHSLTAKRSALACLFDNNLVSRTRRNLLMAKTKRPDSKSSFLVSVLSLLLLLSYLLSLERIEILGVHSWTSSLSRRFPSTSHDSCFSMPSLMSESFSRSASQAVTFPFNETSSEPFHLTTEQKINDYIYQLQQDEELSIESFNMDLQLIAMDDPVFAQSVLYRLEQHENDTKWQFGSIVPNSASYHSIIDGWYNIQQDNKNRQHGPRGFTLSLASSSIDTPRTKGHCPAMEAQRVLELLESRSAGRKMLTPNPLSYLHVCEMWATMRPTSVERLEKAEMILNKYLEQMLNKKCRNEEEQRHRSRKTRKGAHPFVGSNVYSTPKSFSNDSLPSSMHLPASAVQMYSFIIDGWCRLIERNEEAMDRIEGLLQEIESHGGSRTDHLRHHSIENCSNDDELVLGIRPNVMIYTSIITALSRTKVPDMARRADSLLERMKNHGIQQPDLVAYTAVLSCWSKAMSRTERTMASKRALELLREVEHAFLKRQLPKPSPITYGKAIMAIARSFDKEAPTIAESVLRTMMDERNSASVQPTTACWNAVIYAMGSSGKGEEAEALLHEMIHRSCEHGEDAIRPNIKTWGGVIRAYAESGRSDAGQKAQKVLEQMSDVKEEIQIKPNCVCYSTVLKAWARGKAPKNITLRAVDEILQKMESSHDVDIRPNSICYTVAMDAYCRHDTINCGIRSQKLVDRMIHLYAKGVDFDQLKPTVMVMNTLINAWSLSDHPHASRNAENIFRWMESQFALGDESLRPDEISLCNVLNAYANNARNGGAARAQQIMDHIELTASSDPDGIIPLTVQPYNVLIKAWGRSGESDSVDRAERVLRQLERRYTNGEDALRPDLTTYSSVINSAAYFNGGNEDACRQEALDVALRTYQRIRISDGIKANSIVYGTLLKAVAKLTTIGPRRDALMQKFFVECCQTGLVDSFVLSQFRFGSSMAQYRSLVLGPCRLSDEQGGSFQRVQKCIPPQWSRNVVKVS